MTHTTPRKEIQMKTLIRIVVKTVLVTVVAMFTVGALSAGAGMALQHFGAVKTTEHSTQIEGYTTTATR
jgi:hypothetical protein